MCWAPSIITMHACALRDLQALAPGVTRAPIRMPCGKRSSDHILRAMHAAQHATHDCRGGGHAPRGEGIVGHSLGPTRAPRPSDCRNPIMQVTHGAKDQLWCSVGVGRSAAALGCGTPFSGVGRSRDHGPVCPDISVLGERAMVPVPSSARAKCQWCPCPCQWCQCQWRCRKLVLVPVPESVLVPSARVPVSIFGERAMVASASGGAQARIVPVFGFVMVPVPVPVPSRRWGWFQCLCHSYAGGAGASASVHPRASARAHASAKCQCQCQCPCQCQCQ